MLKIQSTQKNEHTLTHTHTHTHTLMYTDTNAFLHHTRIDIDTHTPLLLQEHIEVEFYL